jgi:hypothetical protein
MNILLRIVAYIIPFLIRFCDKHLEDFLEKLYLKIGMKLERRNTDVKLTVVTNVGAKVLVDLGEEKKERIAKEGTVSIIGIDENIEPKVEVSLEGYRTEVREVGKMTESKVLYIDLEKNVVTDLSDITRLQEESKQFIIETNKFKEELDKLCEKYKYLEIAKEYLEICIHRTQ